MNRLLLGTSLIAALASPAVAANYNSIAIDATGNGSNSAVHSLSITQDATGSGNTVSSDGVPGSGLHQFPIRGTWDSVSITQTGSNNTLNGSIKTSSGSASTAALTANYTTTSTGANVHWLTIGGAAAPANPTVVVNVTNDGATDNAITDTLDGASLSYNLLLTGHGNTLTNAVKTTSGGSGITLNQGGSTYGITGNTNIVSNEIGQTSGDAVTGFSSQLTINGSANQITNTVGGSGSAAINAHLGTLGGSTSSYNTVNTTFSGNGANTATVAANGSDNNTINTTLSGGGSNTASLTANGTSYLDYAITSAAAGSAADVTLNGISGSSGAPAVVRVEQTSAATGASVSLNFTGATGLGTLSGTLPGAYASSGAGILVYQNTPGATLNHLDVAASGSSYTLKMIQ